MNQEIIHNTYQNPIWIHFGIGNIFRAYQARLAQEMINQSLMNTGIIAVEGYDEEIVDQIMIPHQNQTLLVTMCSNGEIKQMNVDSIANSFKIEDGFVKQLFVKKSLQLVTFTITEKGYIIANPICNGPFETKTYMEKVCSLLYARFMENRAPLAMVSNDNCSRNGEKLANAMLTIAMEWRQNDQVSEEFIAYLKNDISYPWTMIDKITPRPSEEILKMIGKEELKPMITSKNTYIAPFVNTEESEYLVVEDDFPNGRPKLEEVGVIFTNRETVVQVERMKVCTCLNPLHTALAISGCLLDEKTIADEMNHPILNKMVHILGYKEGLKVVTDPKIMNPEEFLKDVLDNRFTNPYLKDTPWRIATDTSQKLAIRYGETVKEYIRQGINLNELNVIPLVYALWLRYLTGIDDHGKGFKQSNDPRLQELTNIMKKYPVGNSLDSDVYQILKDTSIFGVDLEEVGLSTRVIQLFNEMNTEEGAVLKTIERVVNAS